MTFHEFTRAKRGALAALALFGFFGPNGVFLYHALRHPGQPGAGRLAGRILVGAIVCAPQNGTGQQRRQR